MTDLVHVGRHADILASGRHVGPGDRLTQKDLGDEDQHLLDDGHIVEVSSFGGQDNQLSGAELKARARDLNIEGHSKLSADELRAAIAAAEAEKASAGAVGEEA